MNVTNNATRRTVAFLPLAFYRIRLEQLRVGESHPLPEKEEAVCHWMNIPRALSVGAAPMPIADSGWPLDFSLYWLAVSAPNGSQQLPPVQSAEMLTMIRTE
jgi:hypothetical protein